MLDQEFNAIVCSHSFQPVSVKEESTNALQLKIMRSSSFPTLLSCCFGLLAVPWLFQDKPKEAAASRQDI